LLREPPPIIDDHCRLSIEQRLTEAVGRLGLPKQAGESSSDVVRRYCDSCRLQFVSDRWGPSTGAVLGLDEILEIAEGVKKPSKPAAIKAKEASGAALVAGATSAASSSPRNKFELAADELDPRKKALLLAEASAGVNGNLVTTTTAPSGEAKRLFDAAANETDPRKRAQLLKQASQTL